MTRKLVTWRRALGAGVGLALGWHAAGWVQPGAFAKQEAPAAKPVEPAAPVNASAGAPTAATPAAATATKPQAHPPHATPQGEKASAHGHDADASHPHGAAEHLLPRVDGHVAAPWWYGRVIAGVFWLFAAAAVVGVPIVRMMNAGAKPEPAHDDGHGGHGGHDAHSQGSHAAHDAHGHAKH